MFEGPGNVNFLQFTQKQGNGIGGQLLTILSGLPAMFKGHLQFLEFKLVLAKILKGYLQCLKRASKSKLSEQITPAIQALPSLPRIWTP